jgi:hypothetical protein
MIQTALRFSFLSRAARRAKVSLSSLVAALSLLPLAASETLAASVFTNIADSTTAAPVDTFFFFSDYANQGGAGLFNASYGNDQSGVFAGNGGPLTTIANQGDTGPIGIFDGFGGVSSSGGTPAFLGDSGTNQGIFTGTTGSLTTIAQTGDVASIGTLHEFGRPSISGGTTAFFANTSSGNQGVFTGSGGAPTKIAQTGDPSPIGNFTGVHDFPAISGNTVAFEGFHNSAMGIFTSNGGPMTTIARSGDGAPVGTFNILFDPVISGPTVAFAAAYNGLANSGIFTGSGGALSAIVKSGDAGPDGTFSAFDRYPSISGNTVAFVGHYVDNSYGLFTSTGGTLESLIRTGNPLFGSTVTGLALSSFGADSNSVVFYYELADSRRGVASVTVPEPSSGALAIVGCAAMWWWTKRFSARRS